MPPSSVGSEKERLLRTGRGGAANIKPVSAFQSDLLPDRDIIRSPVGRELAPRKQKAAVTHGRGGVGNLSEHHLPTGVFERVMTYEKGVIQAYKDSVGGENRVKTGRGGVGNIKWTTGLRMRSKASLDSSAFGTLSSHSHSAPSEIQSSQSVHTATTRLIEHPEEEDDEKVPFPSVDRVTANVRKSPSVPAIGLLVSPRKRLPSHQSFHPVPLMEMAAASKVSLLTNASKSSWVIARAKAKSLFSRNEKVASSTSDIELQDIHVEAPAKLRKKREQAATPPPPRVPTPPLPVQPPSAPQRPTHVKKKPVLSSTGRRREVFVFEPVPPTPPLPNPSVSNVEFPKPHGITLTITPNTPTTPGGVDSPVDDRPYSPSVTRPPPPPRSARLDSLIGQSRSPLPRTRDSSTPLPSPLPAATTFEPPPVPAVPPLPNSSLPDPVVRKDSVRRQKSTTKRRPPPTQEPLTRRPSLPKEHLRPPVPALVTQRRRAYTTSRAEIEADAASLDPSFLPSPRPPPRPPIPRTRRPSSQSIVSDAGSDISNSSTAAVARLHRDLLLA